MPPPPSAFIDTLTYEIPCKMVGDVSTDMFMIGLDIEAPNL